MALGCYGRRTHVWKTSPFFRLVQLLERNPEKRLGSSSRDAEDIKAHAFFKDVNWDNVLHKKVPVPFVPTVKVRRSSPAVMVLATL